LAWLACRLDPRQHGIGRAWHDAATACPTVHLSTHPWLTPCSVRRVQPRAHSISMGVMSPSMNAASIPVQWWCTANHVHTYVHAHGLLSLVCLLQAGVQGRLHRRPIWRQPQQQHGVLLECRSKPSCCVAAGSRRVRYIIRRTFGQGHAVELLLLLACSPLSNFAVLACLHTCCRHLFLHIHVLRCCLRSYILHTTHYILLHTACRFACRLNTPPQSMPSRTSEISLPQR
jgi:hypothetical protein